MACGHEPVAQSSVASKAMSTLKTPEFEDPAIPTREYWTNPARMVKTNDRTKPGADGAVENNPPVLED